MSLMRGAETCRVVRVGELVVFIVLTMEIDNKGHGSKWGNTSSTTLSLATTDLLD